MAKVWELVMTTRSTGHRGNSVSALLSLCLPSPSNPFYLRTSKRQVFTALDLTECASIQGKIMFTEPTNADFPLSHNVSRHWASISVVANGIPTPQTTVREKALCVPENPNTSIGNQGQIEMSIDEVCREMVLHCCKLFLQQAGLNLLISMTIINNMFAKSVSDLKFPLISEGSVCAKVQGLEALLGLSEKPVLADEVLAAQMLFSFMLPFMRGGNREMLVEAFRAMLVEALSP
ncbi:protein ARMCX6-like [Microtus oregoni]|uniref:protein ARMCX6-like n=1 Tax=Microtus oregoni TaxID=111838 RepID=UPI001BB1FE2E|nr:protein ARMCX6-like [Microtus oregoni]